MGVGFLAWHRGIDTLVGAQRHQRLRRPTSLHLDDWKPFFLLRERKLFHLGCRSSLSSTPAYTNILRISLRGVLPNERLFRRLFRFRRDETTDGVAGESSRVKLRRADVRRTARVTR